MLLWVTEGGMMIIGNHIMRIIYTTVPLAIFLVLVAFLWKGLQLDPRQLPSVLLNKPVPHFELSDVMDSKIRFTNKNLIGQVSLLNVWATWCLTCRAEHPFLMDLAREQQVAIYGLDYKDDLQESRKWLAQYGNPYRLLGFDELGDVSINLGVYGTPETFVIDKQGIIRYKVIGELTPEIWQKTILPLVMQLQFSLKSAAASL